MDTSIKNGDFETDSTGLPIPIGGQQELMQRAWLRLQVPQGSFCYQPEFGSRLQSLDFSSMNLESESFDAALEALYPLPQVALESVEAVGKDGSVTFRCTVRTAYGRGTVEAVFQKEGRNGNI